LCGKGDFPGQSIKKKGGASHYGRRKVLNLTDKFRPGWRSLRRRRSHRRQGCVKFFFEKKGTNNEPKVLLGKGVGVAFWLKKFSTALGEGEKGKYPSKISFTRGFSGSLKKHAETKTQRTENLRSRPAARYAQDHYIIRGRVGRGGPHRGTTRGQNAGIRCRGPAANKGEKD